MTDNILTFPNGPAAIPPAPPVFDFDQMVRDLTAVADRLAREQRHARWQAEASARPWGFMHFDLAGYGLDLILIHGRRIAIYLALATALAAGLIAYDPFGWGMGL